MKKIILIIAICLSLFSCKNNDYLVDGGISDGNVGTTTMEFIKSHPQLDTMAILLEHAGLADKVNGATTLFVANNVSIRRYINKVLSELREENPKAKFTINDIPTDTLTKYMGAYVFNKILKRENLVKEGKIYTAINGEERRISLEPNSNSYKNQLSSPPEYVYYTLKGGDSWDDWKHIDDDTRVIVRTSNLISTNGVIHVLQGSHTLFNY
jgi:hypothetical protein